MTTRDVRVATWNVHGMRGGIQEIAWVIHAEEIDILLVQESGPRRRLRALGETLGMMVFADPRAFPRRRIQNAVLVRGGFATVVHHVLRRFSHGSFLHPRGVLFVHVGERFSVMSVHLGLRGPERGHHMVELLEHILALRERDGVTLLIVEHDLDFVMRASDRVIVMNNGRVIAQGPPDEVRTDERVVDAYLGAHHDGA